MAKGRNGYVFENDGKWYARVTFTDGGERRHNIKRTLDSEQAAKKTLKSILR